MLNRQQTEIQSDSQIRKFCAYGFLKNLKFFEPYLLIFLMGKGISLFEISILIAVREIIINLFEIPSGLIADHFGRKKELYFSFSFYILSFLCFFLTDSFFTAFLAMVLFGLGEAFRSGTHKAMIYTYLDSKGWQKEKTFVYGKTRSFSLIGSAFGSLAGILLIITVPSINLIFLFSTIPYILDFLLILSYPDFLDNADRSDKVKIMDQVKKLIADFRQNKTLRNLLLEEGIYESTVSFIKDMIQPIMDSIFIGSGLLLLTSLSAEDNLNVILGIVYAVLNLLGSFASRKAYRLKAQGNNIRCLFWLHLLLALSMAVLAAVCRNPFAVFAVYLFIYILFNIRKPVFVDEVDEHIEKSERATILSISSQLKSVFLMISAPLMGSIAERFGFSTLLCLLSLFFFLSLPLLKSGK